MKQERRKEVMAGGILTNEVAKRILGANANEEQKNILFWGRYLERYPELSAKQLNGIEERIDALTKASDETEYVEEMALMIPLSKEDFEHLTEFIKSLPENPSITGATYGTLREKLESPEASHLLNEPERQKFLLQLQTAELEYQKKYGTKPFIPLARDTIDEMIYIVAGLFSVVKPPGTDKEEEQVEANMKLWEDLEPEKTLTFDEAFDQYAINKTLQADPKRWATLTEEVQLCCSELVRHFELLYPEKALTTGFIEVDVEAKDMPTPLSSGDGFDVETKDVSAPPENSNDEGDVLSGPQSSSDQSSQEGDTNKPKNKGKEFMKANGNAMRKMTAPKKSDTLFKKIASKSIDEKLKRLGAEELDAETEGENSIDAQIACGLMESTNQSDLKSITEDGETECGSFEVNESDDSGDEDPAEGSKVVTDDIENFKKLSAEQKGKSAVREDVKEAPPKEKGKGIEAEEVTREEAPPEEVPGIQASEYDSFKIPPWGRFRGMNTTLIEFLVNDNLNTHTMKLDATT